MRQQINFYQPIFHERRTRLSARSAVSLLAVVCAVLSLWRIYDGRQVNLLVREVQSARAQQQRQAELAGAVKAAQAARGNPLSLQAQAKQLAAQVRERQHALEVLRGGAAGTTGGFADRLEAIARRRVSGLWLDHIVLGNAGGVSSLAGQTVDPNLVPLYFQALAAEPVLRGTRFDEFRIGEPPHSETASPSGGDSPGAVDFEARKSTPGATRFRASIAAPRSKTSS